MKNKCLVIGGNGFIGKNLVLSLAKCNYDVVVFDIDTKPLRTSFKNEQGIQYIEGDVNNTSYLINEIRDVDYVIWLIHTTVPATSMFDLEFDLRSNIPPLIRFVQSVKSELNVKKIIYLSSGGTVYGNPDLSIPIVETLEKKPISSYGLTKLVAEKYLSFMLSDSEIDSYILRPSNVYGKYQNLKKPQGLIGHVLKSILMNDTITIFGDGSIIRDYIHVNDLVDAIITCLSNSRKEKEPLILNIGSGVPESINQILDVIGNVTNKLPDIIRKPVRDFDCNYNVISIEKVKKHINWSPKINLNEGIQDVWDWISHEII